MSIKVTSTIDAAGILRSRGLGDSDKARKYLAARVKKYCEPYTPFRQGRLRDAQISNGGRLLIYNVPYAHYHYAGKVMGPNVLIPGVGWRSMAPIGGKHYTGATIQNKVGGPMWDKRMLIDRRKDLEDDLKAYVGGCK